MPLTPEDYRKLLNGKIKPKKRRGLHSTLGDYEINWDANSKFMLRGSQEPFTPGQKYKLKR